MAKIPSLSDIVNILNSISIFNANWDAIQAAFTNTLSRDGSTPNNMEADLDMDSNDLLNVGRADIEELYIDGVRTVSTAAVPQWEGAWVTATAYQVNDLVRESGSTYICLIAHTSGVFADDLTALKWELFAQQGSAGAGTGDMVAANNLSDVASAATSRSNLGLGSVSTENTVPISKGGTGATDAATAKTNLGLAIGTDVQAYDADLAAIASLSRTRGDLITGGASAWDRLAVGTSGQVLTTDGTDVSWGPASGGMTLLGTLATTSGTSHSLTSLDLTEYKSVKFYYSNVTLASSGYFRIGGVQASATGSGPFFGVGEIELTDGVGFSVTANSGSFNSASGLNTAYSTATTEIVVSSNSPAFNGGAIYIYGVK